MNEKLRFRELTPKALFAVLFMALFIVFSKVKLTPIFGLDTQFTASVMFGPVISGFLGIGFGSGAIVLSQLLGVITGIYKIKSITSWLTFTPIIFAGIYFSKMLKGSKKLILIPLLSIFLFLIHPIGREVWYYSFFWIIPIFIVTLKPKLDKLIKNNLAQVYAYSIGSAFTDHSVGSILYLYSMNIPAEFWIQAIPFTLVERAVIAAGITASFFSIKIIISIFQRVTMEETVHE
jgi:hypothetical protein